MTIQVELDKLQNAKTHIRKAIQRKNTGLTIEELYTNYYKYIQLIGDRPQISEAGILDYVESRVYFLKLSEDITSIRPYAFKQVTCLQVLYLSNPETVVRLDSLNAFDGLNKIPKILVPENLLEEYKTAKNWSEISDNIEVYDPSKESTEEMYILQHIDYAQTPTWVESKKLSELTLDFRI